MCGIPIENTLAWLRGNLKTPKHHLGRVSKLQDSRDIPAHFAIIIVTNSVNESAELLGQNAYRCSRSFRRLSGTLSANPHNGDRKSRPEKRGTNSERQPCAHRLCLPP